jgi:hypothetical protein
MSSRRRPPRGTEGRRTCPRLGCRPTRRQGGRSCHSGSEVPSFLEVLWDGCKIARHVTKVAEEVPDVRRRRMPPCQQCGAGGRARCHRNL